MSEMSNEKKETVMDIVAEKRIYNGSGESEVK